LALKIPGVFAGINDLAEKLPKPLRATLELRAFGLFKVPLILFVSPTVLEMTDERCVVKIPLNRRTRNHLGSMYFGTLAVGADVAGGLLAYRLIQKRNRRIKLVFKDFKAEFLKRPEGDVHFVSEDGAAMAKLVAEAEASSERVSAPVHITAYCPAKTGKEPVAQFILTISLKK
jgi:acyl-coenzyme A thioesterase PaaI-like protein